jgi:hypothetical protein
VCERKVTEAGRVSMVTWSCRGHGWLYTQALLQEGRHLCGVKSKALDSTSSFDPVKDIIVDVARVRKHTAVQVACQQPI